MTAQQISYLRREILNIRQATQRGTPDFERLAELHGSNIFTCNYNELGYLIESTMASKEILPGHFRTIITEQNLQYYPIRVRYFFTKKY